MSHYLLFRGINFSLLLHGIVLFLIVYVGNLLPEATPPLKIDFSIEKNSPVSLSGNSSLKLPEPAEERENPKPPIKRALSANEPHQVEKKSEAIKPKQPEPKPVKLEDQKPVPKKLVRLQPKKRLMIEEKLPVTAVEQSTESIPVQIQQKEIEPTIDAPAEPRDAPALIPAAASIIQAQAAPSPKQQYLKVNLSFIRDAVERETRYPDMARRMGWEGKVLIAFTVCPDGLVEDIRVIKSCGFKGLDKNAIDTIKRCAPFPKPPFKAELTLPIIYRLN
jgi:periplasmic protein TonB